ELRRAKVWPAAAALSFGARTAITGASITAERALDRRQPRASGKERSTCQIGASRERVKVFSFSNKASGRFLSRVRARVMGSGTRCGTIPAHLDAIEARNGAHPTARRWADPPLKPYGRVLRLLAEN